jgi:PAS domain S-box-containing protein
VPSSAGQARRLVREVLIGADRRDIVDAAELVVSELVTNALLHTATMIDVTAHVDDQGLLVHVADESVILPAERDHWALAGTGRGLTLVHQLTDEWGVTPLRDGKAIWVRINTVHEPSPPDLDAYLLDGPAHVGAGVVSLATDDQQAATHDAGSIAGTAAALDREPMAVVVLRNVPLLMHSAWHEHAETLLREYLLARLEDDEATALIEHAAASAAMALLHDQVPRPVLPEGMESIDDLSELLTAVVGPGATLTEGRLHVPAATVLSFQMLNLVLDAALAFAETGRLLAAPTQPELRELRRWLCGQVASQSNGAQPSAWQQPFALAAPGTGVTDTDWDHTPVDRSTKAVVAADDTNRIIAVSPPALEALGYDDPDQLLGQRLLTLIPTRFHQGHLAGFTLYLTHGRAPLIGTTATVPFLRADGTETLLDLHIEALSVGDGRRVFVATLGKPTEGRAPAPAM